MFAAGSTAVASATHGLLAGPLMAAADDAPANYDALALSWGAGWMMFAIILGFGLFFASNAELVRRLLLRAEDPRPMAVFRIVFGAFAFCNIHELSEHFIFLFTDEGIFPTEVARHVRARGQFAGFGDGMAPGEGHGFYGFWAFAEWLKGPNYSLLLFWDTPTAFYVHLVAFEIAMVMLIIGFQTRWVKWVALVLFNSIIMRNTLFWEGTENVYRALFFYLALSRCGEAYSVDNFLRTRRLRKAGLLSEPGKPGDGAGALPSDEHPKGLEPVYRLIPAWPRWLVMLQIGALYMDTGVLKNGPVWNRGDAFYYAIHLDHFYRLPPQQLGAWFGTNLFRLNTHVVHVWESAFPVVILGLILRWLVREDEPRPASQSTWQKWTGRLGLLMVAAGFYALILHLYPVHYAAPEGGPSLRTAQILVGILAPVLVLAVVGLYWWLRYHPPEFELAGRRFVIDLNWVGRWVMGRRIWLGLGMLFHGHLLALMQIGWFTPALLSTYCTFFNGAELSRLPSTAARGLGKLGIPTPAFMSQEPIPVARYDLPQWHRDGHRLPPAAIFSALAVAALGVVRDVQTRPNFWPTLNRWVEAKTKHKRHVPEALLEQVPTAYWGWFGLFILLYVLTLAIRQVRGYRVAGWVHPAFIGVAWLASVVHAQGLVHMSWGAAAVVFLVLVGSMGEQNETIEPIPAVDDETGRPRPPWGHGMVGRVLAGALVLYHVTAVGVWLLPDKTSMDTFRLVAREPFKMWLKNTQTAQGWAMFAPNPPKRNVFLRVLVTDDKGEVYDLNTDVYACLMEGSTPEICDAVYPIPWIWYSRTRKMNRRIAGSEGGNGIWYQKWYGRYVCRQWALENGGEGPRQVELIKVTYPIPSPEEVAEKGPYDPATRYRLKASQRTVHKVVCAKDVEGQLSNEVRRRHGLPEVDEGSVKHFYRWRCDKWAKELMKRDREWGREVDPEDPRYDFCGDESPSKKRKKKKKARKSK